MSEHIEEKKTFEPLNSVSVLDLRQDIVDLIHNIDKDESLHQSTCLYNALLLTSL